MAADSRAVAGTFFYPGRYKKKKESRYMANNKYDKYFLKDPWGVLHPGTDPKAPVYIG
jgi:hypothetical protein